MIAGFSLLNINSFNKESINILVLGSGLCALSKFIYNHFQNSHLVNVEVSHKVTEIAKTHLPLILNDPRFEIIVDDPFSYVMNIPLIELPITHTNSDDHTLPDNKQDKEEQEEGDNNEEEGKDKNVYLTSEKTYDVIIIDVVND